MEEESDLWFVVSRDPGYTGRNNFINSFEQMPLYFRAVQKSQVRRFLLKGSIDRHFPSYNNKKIIKTITHNLKSLYTWNAVKAQIIAASKEHDVTAIFSSLPLILWHQNLESTCTA